jgi:predicted deacetylase
MQLTLLVSLHDVTPFHQSRLQRAEERLVRLGVSCVTYLFVPNFHREWPARESPPFVAWTRGARPYRVEWVLHGYWHLADPPSRSTPSAFVRQRWLTEGEGEFLCLTGQEIRRRLTAGVVAFEEVIGERPRGFVPPAWLSNAALAPVLAECGIPFTEDRRHIHDVMRRRTIASPVITWATRSDLRRHGSLVVCPLLAHAFSNAQVLRIAIHPYDFDHPRTVASIERVVEAAMDRRRCATYGGLEYSGWRSAPGR